MHNLMLFIDEKNRYRALESDELICSACQKKLKDFFILSINWNTRKPSILNMLCEKCNQKQRQLGEVTETKLVLVVDKLKQNLTPVLISKPQLVAGDGDLTTFDAVNKATPKVIDKTKYAGRESFEGALIGADIKEQLTSKDAPLRLEQAKKILDEVQK